MLEEQDLTFDELANMSGLNPRTLRYYMQEGLLPGPDTQGKYARYSHVHLDRLALILHLKTLRIPLKEIRNLLDTLTPDQIREMKSSPEISELTSDLEDMILTEDSKVVRQGNQALDYIRNLNKTYRYLDEVDDSVQVYAKNPTRPVPEKTIEQGAPGAQAPNPRQRWERIPLIDGVELHIREDRYKANELAISQFLKAVKLIWK